MRAKSYQVDSSQKANKICKNRLFVYQISSNSACTLGSLLLLVVTEIPAANLRSQTQPWYEISSRRCVHGDGSRSTTGGGHADARAPAARLHERAANSAHDLSGVVTGMRANIYQVDSSQKAQQNP
jgi:hypothetical protein